MSLRHDGADRIQEVGLASVDTCHQPERPERKALLSLGPVPDTPRAAGDLGFAMEALSVCFGQKRRAITALVQVEPPEQAVGAYVAARQGGPKLACSLIMIGWRMDRPHHLLSQQDCGIRGAIKLQGPGSGQRGIMQD